MSDEIKKNARIARTWAVRWLQRERNLEGSVEIDQLANAIQRAINEAVSAKVAELEADKLELQKAMVNDRTGVYLGRSAARVVALEEVAKIAHGIITQIMDPGPNAGNEAIVTCPNLTAGQVRAYRRKIADVAYAKAKEARLHRKHIELAIGNPEMHEIPEGGHCGYCGKGEDECQCHQPPDGSTGPIRAGGGGS